MKKCNSTSTIEMEETGTEQGFEVNFDIGNDPFPIDHRQETAQKTGSKVTFIGLKDKGTLVFEDEHKKQFEVGKKQLNKVIHQSNYANHPIRSRLLKPLSLFIVTVIAISWYLTRDKNKREQRKEKTWRRLISLAQWCDKCEFDNLVNEARMIRG